jgi:hypothetical protein
MTSELYSLLFLCWLHEIRVNFTALTDHFTIHSAQDIAAFVLIIFQFVRNRLLFVKVESKAVRDNRG